MLAIYMGRAAATDIARELIAAGRAPDTPVLIAVNVSLPNERLIRGQLSALAFLVRAISETDPTLLLVGSAIAPNEARAPAVVVEADRAPVASLNA
jgi:uroporphyrin-III C-methyltransferase